MANSKNKLSLKGLEKIFGSQMNQIVNEIEKKDDFKKENTTTILIKNIVKNPYQPRKFFDVEKLNELADSIKINGVIQPILVREKNNIFQIIAGERRLKASKKAGLEKIPAIILDLNDIKMQEFAIIENLQREDLNLIEEAVSFKNLLKNANLTQEKLAKRIGKSRPYISNCIRILDLPLEVKELLKDKKLTFGHIKPLLSSNITIKDKIIIAKKAVQNNWSVREVEKFLVMYNLSKFSKTSNNKKTSKSKSNSINFFLERNIMEKLGTKVEIKPDKLIINYSNISDLNRILNILNLKNW